MSSWDQFPTQFFFPTTNGFEARQQLLAAHQANAFHSPMQSPSFVAENRFAPYPANCSDSSSSDSSSGKKRRGGKRYKAPSPEILKSRRNAANERERRRMLMLNDAYDKLRTMLPNVDGGRRMSKFETLQAAQFYINNLASILCESTPIKPEQ